MTTFQKAIKYVATGFAVFLAVAIIVSILQGIQFFTGAFFSGSSETIDDKQTFKAKDVKTLSINSDISDIVFTTSEDNSTITIDSSNAAKSYKCTINEDGNLSIKNKNTKSLFFNFFKSDCKIIVSLPKDLELTKVSIEQGVGDIKIEYLTSLSTDLKLGISDIHLSKIVSEKLSIDNGIGDVKISKCDFGNSNFDCGIGDILVEDSTFKDSDIDNGIGDIKFNLLGDIDKYSIEIDNGIGDKKVNNKSYSEYNGSNSSYKMEIDNGIGDVKIIVK